MSLVGLRLSVFVSPRALCLKVSLIITQHETRLPDFRLIHRRIDDRAFLIINLIVSGGKISESITKIDIPLAIIDRFGPGLLFEFLIILVIIVGLIVILIFLITKYDIV